MRGGQKIPPVRTFDLFLRLFVVGEADVIHQIAYLPHPGLFSLRILYFLDDHGSAARFSEWPRPDFAGRLLAVS